MIEKWDRHAGRLEATHFPVQRASKKSIIRLNKSFY